MFMTLMLIIVICLLLMVAAIWPHQPSVSQFEIERRLKISGDVRLDAMRADVYLELTSIKRVLEAVLLIMVVPFAIVAINWFFGIVFAALLAVEYSAIARLGFIRKPSQQLYDRYEIAILEFVGKYRKFFAAIKSFLPNEPSNVPASREELDYQIRRSGAIISNEERQLLLYALKFRDLTVESVMTPRSVIASVKAHETIGPLVLDELHKTGHSRFPVIGEDVDDVRGVLYIQDLITLRDHDSKTAEQAMNKTVYFIDQKKSLSYALGAFLKTRHHLFIVVNEFAETVGLVSLEDVMESLIGREIIDEFDSIEDLRIAARDKKPNGQEA